MAAKKPVMPSQAKGTPQGGLSRPLPSQASPKAVAARAAVPKFAYGTKKMPMPAKKMTGMEKMMADMKMDSKMKAPKGKR